MDEREAWRPKIFYSAPGPNQGFPEPFPAPTHLRRKERSGINRGARGSLFFPGSSVGGGGGLKTFQQRERDRDRDRDRDRGRVGFVNGDGEQLQDGAEV
jgi:hypothetical protein